MIQTLVIYDNNGKIFTQIAGDFNTPVGLQYIITTIPEGKKLVGVDVSREVHEPIFEDIPPSENELLSKKLEQTQEAIDFLIMNGGM